MYCFEVVQGKFVQLFLHEKINLPLKFCYQFSVLRSIFFDFELIFIKEISISYSKNMEICNRNKADKICFI